LELLALLGTEEAVVAHLLETVGQDMLEEAADEVWGREGGKFLPFGLAVLITKSDLAVFEFEDPVVAEGHAEDIGGEIFESSLAAADGLTIHDPILVPDLRWQLAVEGSFLEGVAELGAEDFTQSLDGDQESGVFGWEPLALGRKATGGDEIVDVRMVAEIAGPGL
jgi:hypothetical protein